MKCVAILALSTGQRNTNKLLHLIYFKALFLIALNLEMNTAFLAPFFRVYGKKT